MFNFLKKTIKSLPGIRQLVQQGDSLEQQLSEKIKENESLRAELKDTVKRQGFVPAGHFYSPVPDFDQIKKDQSRIFAEHAKTVPGIELNENAQLELLEKFTDYYEEMPFQAEQQEGLRYRYNNPAYSYSDAIHLHCLIRHLQPRRIIEVGSGFSSCMMLDTNELHFDNAIQTTFIEPYPELLLSLVKEQDKERINVISTRLQDVDLAVFDALQANDILFIDSTHVSKIDSDVNRILFEILPRIKQGVYIHFHDIFFPFEYSSEWVFEGRAWTEAYALKAFLQFNQNFEIVLMNTFMHRYHAEFYQQNLPLSTKNTGGSIWLRKV
jgi:predicted O-methyltransferase YrrM